jgi:FkbM family methyltransferase
MSVVISPSVSGIKYVIYNQNDIIQNRLLNGSQWNEDIITLIKQYISDRNLHHLLNVGSHIGSVCLPVSLHIDKVTAIEAYPATYKHLCENIELNNLTNVTPINIAVGNSEEDIYFMSIDKICPIENINRIKNNSGGMHVFTERDILNNMRSAVLSDKKITNKVNKLDNLQKQIEPFDIMLVDIEGFEYDFLLGAEQSIKQHQPVIIIEIWDDNKRKKENMNQPQEDVINYIKSLGYKVVGNHGDDFIFEPCVTNVVGC